MKYQLVGRCLIRNAIMQCGQPGSGRRGVQTGCFQCTTGIKQRITPFPFRPEIVCPIYLENLKQACDKSNGMALSSLMCSNRRWLINMGCYGISGYVCDAGAIKDHIYYL